MKTILARTPAALLSYLSRLPSTYSKNVVLFALSANVGGSELSSLVSRLTSLSPQSVGCLSAPLNLDGNNTESMIACSLAVFKPEDCVPFRSTIPGAPKAQVGRWRAFRETVDTAVPPPEVGSDVDWRELWGKSSSANSLPVDLHHLKPGNVSSVIYFSDASPEGLANSLGIFRSATKIGLVASSTPFVTGRPMTLFHNDKIYSSGGVGVALTGLGEKLKSFIEFPQLTPITGRLTVTQSEGNLINGIDASSPAGLLLGAIQRHNLERNGIDESDQFYLGALDGDELRQLYHITSGDPSRGTIALDAYAAPTNGTPVKFYHLPESCSPPSLGQTQPGARVLRLMTSMPLSQPDSGPNISESNEDGETCVVHDGFSVASENGLVLESETERPWRCTIPGAVVTLEIQ